MTVPGAHACRAAADDLNTALGGDLKLTTFGPRLPELSPEAAGLLLVRRILGEFVRTVTISWSTSPSGDGPGWSILAACAECAAENVRCRCSPSAATSLLKDTQPCNYSRAIRG